jgi:hypothetical protein
VWVAGAAWRAATRTMAGVGDLVQRIGDSRIGRVPGGRAVERSVNETLAYMQLQEKVGAWVSWLSLKTKVDGLSVVWPQNHWDGFSSVWASKLTVTVYEWFGLKTTRTVFTGWASKPMAMVSGSLASKPVVTVSQFGPQNQWLRCGDLGLKITATDSWFGPQNQAGFGLSVAPQN